MTAIVAGTVTLWGVFLLAQNASSTPTVTQEVAPWMQIGSSIGFAGLVFYLITVMMPRREKEHADQLGRRDEQVVRREKEHADLLRESYKEYASLVTAERESCEKRHQEMLTAFQSLTETVTKSHEVIREVRHEVNNIAHSRAMEKAVQEAKAKQSRGT